MKGEFSRPSVQEMIFSLYARPLHPELFETLACRQVQREDYTLTVRITPEGHVLTWQSPDVYLAEVTAGAQQLLPSSGNLIRHRFQGERSNAVKPLRGVGYQICSQLEILPPEIFVHVHEEIRADGAKRGLLYQHCPHHRLALSPLGFITVEAWRGTLSVNTFHTFPDDCAIVKTQSLIERC
jgi:Protein of unknown function DUF2617